MVKWWTKALKVGWGGGGGDEMKMMRDVITRHRLPAAAVVAVEYEVEGGSRGWRASGRQRWPAQHIAEIGEHEGGGIRRYLLAIGLPVFAADVM